MAHPVKITVKVKGAQIDDGGKRQYRLHRCIPPRIRSWLAEAAGDSAFTRVARNAGVILSGNAASSAFGLVSAVLTARHLGAASFGMLVLAQSYALVIDRLLNFQSWQALIKFGSHHLEDGDYHSFRSITQRLLLLDASSAVIAATIAWFGISVATHQFGWADEHVLAARLFSVAIVIHLSGVPTGVLRLFDRFGKYALATAASSAVRLALIIVGVVSDRSFIWFAIAWVAADVVLHGLLIAFAARVLHERELHHLIRPLPSRTRGLWRFVVTTNLYSSLRMATRELDVLLIGGALTPVAVGLYKVAKQFGSAILRISDPLYVSIFPELARRRAADDAAGFVSLMRRSAAVAAIFGAVAWLAFAVAGKPLITLLMGPEFAGVYPILLAYIVALFLALITLPMQPAMLAMGRPDRSLIVLACSTAGYLMVLVPLLRVLDVVGAAVAYIIFYLLWGGSMGYQLRHAMMDWRYSSESLGR